MNILKQNTSPILFIIPRNNNFGAVLKLQLVNEMNQKTQNILTTFIYNLSNENISIILASFPTGKIGDKFSYSLIDNVTSDIICLGKLMIVSQTENIQDYEKKTNNKFYK